VEEQERVEGSTSLDELSESEVAKVAAESGMYQQVVEALSFRTEDGSARSSTTEENPSPDTLRGKRVARFEDSGGATAPPTEARPTEAGIALAKKGSSVPFLAATYQTVHDAVEEYKAHDGLSTPPVEIPVEDGDFLDEMVKCGDGSSSASVASATDGASIALARRRLSPTVRTLPVPRYNEGYKVNEREIIVRVITPLKACETDLAEDTDLFLGAFVLPREAMVDAVVAAACQGHVLEYMDRNRPYAISFQADQWQYHGKKFAWMKRRDFFKTCAPEPLPTIGDLFEKSNSHATVPLPILTIQLSWSMFKWKMMLANGSIINLPASNFIDPQVPSMVIFPRALFRPQPSTPPMDQAG
jgi:hypothetical protein